MASEGCPRRPGEANKLQETLIGDRRCAERRKIGVGGPRDLRSHEDGVVLWARRREDRGSRSFACRKRHSILGLTLAACRVEDCVAIHYNVTSRPAIGQRFKCVRGSGDINTPDFSTVTTF